MEKDTRKIEILPYPKEMLEFNTPYTYTRWGDGEWAAVLQNRPGSHNCDKHKYFPEMGKELSNILQKNYSKNFYYGMQTLAARIYEKEIINYIYKNNINIQWISNEFLRWIIVKHNSGWKELYSAFNTRDSLLIGPKHLKNKKLLPVKINNFYTISSENCYLDIENIIDGSLNVVSSLPEGSIISISASMPASIIMEKLYLEFGEKHWIIDFGSVWDQFVGVYSRRYMKTEK